MESHTITMMIKLETVKYAVQNYIIAQPLGIAPNIIVNIVNGAQI
jgi:predicted RNA-binding protein